MLYPKFVKQIHRKKQKTHCLFALIAFTGLFFYQHLAHSQQYVIVDSENGDIPLVLHRTQRMYRIQPLGSIIAMGWHCWSQVSLNQHNGGLNLLLKSFRDIRRRIISSVYVTKQMAIMQKRQNVSVLQRSLMRRILIWSHIFRNSETLPSLTRLMRKLWIVTN